MFYQNLTFPVFPQCQDGLNVLFIRINSSLNSCMVCIPVAMFCGVDMLQGAHLCPGLWSISPNHLPLPGIHITNSLWVHNWKFVLFPLCFSWSNQVPILHMPWQHSCHGMCKIGTWSDHYFSCKSNIQIFKIQIMNSTICWDSYLEFAGNYYLFPK